MSIIDIKSTVLRRAALVLLIVPLMLATVIWHAIEGARDILREMPSLFRDVWRGKA